MSHAVLDESRIEALVLATDEEPSPRVTPGGPSPDVARGRDPSASAGS